MQENSAGLKCLTWIAILRAIKSSHVPISNVVASTYWIVFRSRDAWTINSCCRCSGAGRTVEDLARLVILWKCQGDQQNHGQLHDCAIKKNIHAIADLYSTF